MIETYVSSAARTIADAFGVVQTLFSAAAAFFCWVYGFKALGASKVAFASGGGMRTDLEAAFAAVTVNPWIAKDYALAWLLAVAAGGLFWMALLGSRATAVSVRGWFASKG